MARRVRALTWVDLAFTAYGAACLLMGGASAAGAIVNGILQLAGIAILAALAVVPNSDPAASIPRAVRLLIGCLCAVVAVQFLPLPPAVWASLPGRSAIFTDYQLLGLDPPWLPVSLAPDRAVGSALALIPCLATFMLATRATSEGRVAYIWIMIAVAAVSIGIGSVQKFSNGQSHLYFYQITNRSDAVGFFANKNHLATLFLMTLPFIAALAAREEQSDRKRHQTRRPLFISSFAFILFGTVLNNSSAGLALLIPSVGTSILIYRRGIGRPVPAPVVAIGAAVLAGALLFVSVGPFHGRFLDKAISSSNSATRGTSISNTLKAAGNFMPLGSGLGSFRRIYTGYEDIATVNREYINHAHSDWAEVALETGLMGVALLIALCLWLGKQSWLAWRGDKRTGSMIRAALTALVLLLLHSFVDYPARTAAILSVAGMAFGILAAPRAASRASSTKRDDEQQESQPVARSFVAD